MLGGSFCQNIQLLLHFTPDIMNALCIILYDFFYGDILSLPNTVNEQKISIECTDALTSVSNTNMLYNVWREFTTSKNLFFNETKQNSYEIHKQNIELLSLLCLKQFFLSLFTMKLMSLVISEIILSLIVYSMWAWETEHARVINSVT